MSFIDSEKRVDLVFHHYLYLHYLWSPQGYLNVVVKVLCGNNNNITCESQLQCNTYFNIFFKEEVTV